jgi:hypothetical protein
MYDQAFGSRRLDGHCASNDSGHLHHIAHIHLSTLAFQEMKRKNGVLTLQGVGVFQGLMGALNIDDVKCIRDALIKVYLPIIMADPELNAQYNTAVKSLQRINERINRESDQAVEDPSTVPQAAAGGNSNPFA